MTDDSILHYLLNNQPNDAVYVLPWEEGVGVRGNFSAVNDTACRMLGYTREELLQMGPTQIDPLAAKSAQHISGKLNEGARRIESVHIARDGTRIPVELTEYMLNTQSGPVALTVSRDISELKQRETEAELNKQRFNALYRLSIMLDEPEAEIMRFALEEGVRMTQSEVGYIFSMNREQTELTLHSWSRSVEELCPFFKQDHPVTAPVDEAGIWADAVLQHQPLIINDYEALPEKKGQPEGHIPIRRHLGLPVIENDRVVLMVGVGNKEEEYTESDVLQLSLLMSGMWRILQRKRMEHELIHAKQKAEKVSETKSQFLANMSHELRTPLNGIMGMTQLLLTTELSTDQEQYLNLSLDACRHLTGVVTDLLSLSSIESGGVTLTMSNFDLPAMLEEMTTPLRLQAEEKSLTLDLTIEDNIPALIRSDEGKLRQILINLLFNALKFTHEGNITLEVTHTHIPGEQTRFDFTVTDTGIGIPEERQEEIFESFTQGEEYLTKEYGGSGLGLTISRHLAELLGGTITVRSTPGKGSSFRLSLPLAEISQLEPPTSQEEENQCAEASAELPPLNILLAEDEHVNSIMASRILKKAGHSVTIVYNGQEALDALTHHPFDLVLMDVQMPRVNGVEATEFIRSGEAPGVPSDLPVIGITAYAHPSEMDSFIEAGMHRVVTKPFEMDELLTAIAETMTECATRPGIRRN